MFPFEYHVHFVRHNQIVGTKFWASWSSVEIVRSVHDAYDFLISYFDDVHQRWSPTGRSSFDLDYGRHLTTQHDLMNWDRVVIDEFQLSIPRSVIAPFIVHEMPKVSNRFFFENDEFQLCEADIAELHAQLHDRMMDAIDARLTNAEFAMNVYEWNLKYAAEIAAEKERLLK